MIHAFARVGAVAAVVLAAAAASAQPTPDGAAEIAEGFRAWLQDQQAESGRELRFAVDGEIRAGPIPGGYLMTVGGMSVTVAQLMRISWGEFEIELAPQANGWLEATWQLPGQVQVEDLAGGPPVTLSIGANSGTGVIAPEYETMMVADIALETIAVVNPGPEGALAIDSILLISESNPQADPGVFDTTTLVTVDGLSVTDAEGKLLTGLKSLTLDFSVDDIDFPRYARLVEQLAVAGALVAPAAPQRPTEPPAAAEAPAPVESPVEPPAAAEAPAPAEPPAVAAAPAEPEAPVEPEAPAEPQTPAEAEAPAEPQAPAEAQTPAEAEPEAPAVAEAPAEEPDPAVEAARRAALEQLVASWGDGGLPLNGLSLLYRVDGLVVDLPGLRLTLAEAGFDFGIDGLIGNATHVGTGLSFADLAIEPPVPMADFVPTAATIDLALVDLPNQAIGQALVGFFQDAPGLGPDIVGPAAIGRLWTAMQASNAAFEIRRLALDAKIGALDATGRVEPEAEAPLGAVGNLVAAVAGLDQIAARLESDPELRDALPFVTLLQRMGQAATDANGQPIQRFALDVNANGQVLMNGTDLGPMIEDLTE